MFGKIVVGKALAGLAAAGVVSGALATGVLAAPAAATASASPTAPQRQPAARKDAFAGTVTAISDTQLTVKGRAGASRTFLRDASTRVYRGKDQVAWSEIEVNSHVGLRFAERNGKLYAVRIRIGRAHTAGRVQSVKGNVIITHGRARRRMIGYGVGVAATMARTRVPELIAEALRPDTGDSTTATAAPEGEDDDGSVSIDGAASVETAG